MENQSQNVGKSASSLPLSATSGYAGGAASSPDQEDQEPVSAHRGGKRVAAKSDRALRAVAADVTPPADTAPSSSHPAPSVGKRRAPTARRRRLPRLVLVSPARVGFLAIGLAVAGVLELGVGGATLAPVDIQLFTSQANVLNGSGAIQTVGYRTTAPSRSTDRTTLADATDQELQAAAEQQAAARTEAISSMTKTAVKFAQRVAENAWQLPITAGDYVLTARFGDYGIWAGMHTGLDFAAPEGTEIHAIANGTITFTGYDGAYGNKTIETLPNGTELWYCHQSAIAVKVGDQVIAGQLIGNVGSTGHTTGPHLHLEVRPGGGDPVDPYQALIFHGVQP